MNKSVVIYGPQGSGKTSNAQKFMKHFKLNNILDGWDGETKVPTHGALILTNVEPTKDCVNRRYISVKKALTLVGEA